MNISKIKPAEKPVLHLLENIPDAPKNLYYLGNLDGFGAKSVAIIGSRRPTEYGKEITYKIAHGLTNRGINIISGLAFGVDAISHKACLEAGGKTIAVLASGVDDITPRSNRGLGQSILDNYGAIISEYPLGHVVQAWNFLERNRIVSGIADAVVVTEATSRSGTLSTAAHCLNQGHDLFVVPGNITSQTSAGCNKLISQGAQIITSVEDLINQLAPIEKTKQTKLPFSKDPRENQIIKIIASGVNDGEEIIKQAKMSASDFNYLITMLEIKNIVKSLGGNKWIIK